MVKTQFDTDLTNMLAEVKGELFPVKASLPERILIKQGSPELLSLQYLGYDVWVYTSSFRSERYIRTLFRLYGVRFDGIVNGNRHLNEVQKGHSQTLPQKVPSHYGISLHVDDEEVICSYGREYGFDAFQLEANDDDWKEKVIERAFQVKRKHEVVKNTK